MVQEPYDDTEYQFDEGEEGEVVYEEGEDPSAGYEAPAEKKVSKLSKKNIIILMIMAIIAVFIIYKIFSLLFGGFVGEKPTVQQSIPSVTTTQISPPAAIVTPEEEKVGMEEAQVTPAPEADVPIAPVVPVSEEEIPPVMSPEIVSQQEVDQAQMAPDFRESISNQVSKLQEEHQQLVQDLKNQQNTTQNRLTSLNDKVEDLNTSVNDLRDVVRDLSSQVKKVEVAERLAAKRRMQATQVREQKVRAEQQYFVEAVIPGRAWLRAYDGSALTVTIGDDIPGYGKVTSINSYSGVVTTSSGNEIYYGVNG